MFASLILGIYQVGFGSLIKKKKNSQNLLGLMFLKMPMLQKLKKAQILELVLAIAKRNDFSNGEF